MNYIVIFLVVFINFILQSTLLQVIEISGIVPNTSLILVIIFGLLEGKKTGSIVGLLAGIIQDIFFGGVIGVNAFIYSALGWWVGLLDNKVFKDNLFLPFITVAVSTFIYHILYYLFMIFLSIDVSFTVMIKDILLKDVVYSSVVSIFIYRKMLKFYRKPKMRFTK